MDITQSLQNAFDDIVQFVPRALAFLAILVIGWIVAKFIGKMIGKLLAKVGLDRLGERSGVHRFTGRFELSGLFGKLVYYTLLLFTLQLAFGAFGPNPVSDLLNDLVAWLPQLFVAILIVVVAMAIANAVYGLINGMLSNTGYGKTLARIAQVAIVFIGAVAATSQVGIADSVTQPLLWTVLAAVAGVVIVGVGGGLIQPMRQRWERMLNTAENETSKMRSTTQSTSDPLGQTYTSERYGADTDEQPGARSQTSTEARAQAPVDPGSQTPPTPPTERP
ncbi:mechanosensitive ion channel family protein [Glycomyces tarimensis]